METGKEVQKPKSPINETKIGGILGEFSEAIIEYRKNREKLQDKLNFMIVSEEQVTSSGTSATTAGYSCDLEEGLKTIRDDLCRENNEMRNLIDSIWC